MTTTTDEDQPPAGERRHWSGPARRLLEAAGELFYEQGAVATTVREITSACGLSPGALYNHFPSKEDLLFELVLARHLHLEEDVAAAQAAAAGDPAAELAAIVRVYVQVHVRGRRGARVANREYPHLSGEKLATVVAVRRRLRDRVVDVLVEGSRRGVFHVDGAPDHSAMVIAASSILDMCIHCGEWLHEGAPLSLAEIEARYVTMCLRVVGAPAGHLAARPLPG